MPNPYDSLVGQTERETNPYGSMLDADAGTRVRSAGVAARSLNPAAIQRANEIAQRNGWDADAVHVDLPTFEEEDRLAQMEKAAVADPKLGGWLADPKHAALARDDLPALSRLSSALHRAITPHHARSWGELATDAGIAFRQGARGALASMAETPVNAVNLVNREFNRTADSVAGLFGQRAAPIGMYEQPGVVRWLRESADRLGESDRGRMSFKANAQAEGRPDTFLAGAAYTARNPSMLVTDVAGSAGAMLGSGVVPGSTWGTVTTQAAGQAGMAGDEAAKRVLKRGGSPQEAQAAAADAFALAMGVGLIAPRLTPGGSAVESMIARDVSGITGATARRSATAFAGETASETAEEYGVAVATNIGAGDPWAKGAGGAAAAGLTTGAAFAAPAAAREVWGDHAEGQRARERDRIKSVGRAFMSTDDAVALASATNAAAESKTGEMAPGELEALVGPDAGHVYVPADMARTLYQSDDVPFESWLADVTGDPNHAAIAGESGDVAIPAAKWFAVVARLPNKDEWLRHARRDVDGYSPADMERVEFFDELFGVDISEAAARATPMDPDAREALKQDVLGQLIGTGRMSRSQAEANAEITVRGLEAFGRKTGRTPQQILEQFRLNIGTGRTAVNAKPDTLDLRTRELIRAVRDNAIPAEAEVMGQSLVGFILKAGGLQDFQGDLKSRDAGKQRPGLINNATGVALDYAREAAVEAGYLPEGADINDLLDAIDAELRGTPVYSEQQADPDRRQFRDDALSLQRDFNEAFDGVPGDVLNSLTEQQIADYLSGERAEVDRLLGRTSEVPGILGRIAAKARELYQAAFHGSPHKFDRFDLSKMGTGEGAQAYGWGMYFANRREVAESYRAAGRQSGPVQFRGEGVMNWALANRATYDAMTAPEKNALAFAADAASLDEAKFNAEQQGDSEVITVINRMIAEGDLAPAPLGGQLYAVDIPEDGDLLDWDAPLSEQPEKVRHALFAWAGEMEGETQDEFYRMLYDSRMTGGEFYRALSGGDVFDSSMDDDKGVSKSLLAAGIPGLRYLDGGSRASGTGSHNYVIWDEAQIKVERTFYQGAVPEESEIERLRAKLAETEAALGEERRLRRTSPVTGLRNKIAFDEDAELGWPEVVAIDVDGLKKLNDALGHEGADQVLRVLGAQLAQQEGEGARFYHRSGDEFAARVRDPGASAAIMSTIRDVLEGTAIDVEVVRTDGTTVDYTVAGIGVSYGIGESYEVADARAEQDKSARLAAGTREDPRAPGPSRRVNAVAGNPGRREGDGQGPQPQTERVDPAAGGVSASGAFDFSPGARSVLIGDTTIDYAVARDGETADVTLVSTPQEARGQGSARRAMLAFTAEADRAGLTLFLTADPMGKGGPGKSALRDFYRSLGFRPNKGRRADFRSRQAMVRDPSALFQQPRRNNKPRGQLRIGTDGSFSIDLLANADASTFVHELGHYFLEVMGALANEAGADASLVADFDAVLRAGKVAGDTPEARRATWAAMDLEAQRHVHEGFAEGFEQYLQEGKAPSEDLVGVFAQFRAWLFAIYRALRLSRVELTDEVRGVYDRLLATDEEIEAVNLRQGFAPMVDEATALAAGIEPDEFAAYKARLEAATEAAKARLGAKVLRALRRERSEWWRAESAKMRETVEAEFEALPIIRALRVMQGRNGPVLKLDTEATRALFPTGKLPDSLRALGVTKADGVSPDAAAMILGFSSGSELVNGLVTARDLLSRIDAETEGRMRERHGDPMDGLGDQAMRAAHNDKRVRVLEDELRMLELLAADPTAIPQKSVEGAGNNSGNNPSREMSPEQRQKLRAQAAARAQVGRAFKAIAEQRVAGQRVRDLRPAEHLAAERRAAKRAAEAAASGDYVRAATAKREQILAGALYRASRNAQVTADKQVRAMKRAAKPSAIKRLGKAGKSYVDALKLMLDGHELRPASRRKVERREALREWVEKQQEAMHVTRVSPELLARVEAERVVNVADLTVQELTDLSEAVKNLLHLAKLKNTLLKNADAREWAEARAELLERVRQEWPAGKPSPFNASDLTRIEALVAGFGAAADWTVRPETMIEWLDGGESGPWHDYYWQQIEASREERRALNRSMADELAKATERLPKAERANLDELVHVPWLGRSVSRHTIVSLLLNLGTKSSRDKLIRGGYMVDGVRVPFDEVQVAGLLSHLSPAQADMVQGIWDALETLWPRIAAHEEAMSGFAPPKLERQQVVFTARDGSTVTLQGGYFPAVYDPDAGRGGELQAQAQEQRMMGDDFTPAVTSKGHTQARTEYAAPMLLDYHQVLTRHVGNVITDLSYRRTLQQLLRILNDVEIRGAMKDRISPSAHKVLMGSLRHTVAGPQRVADGIAEPIANVMRATIRNTVVAALGFKVVLAAANIVTAPFLAMIRTQGRFVAAGLARYYANPRKQTEIVHALSPFMAARAETTLVGYEQVMAELRGLQGWRHRMSEIALAIHHTINPIIERGLWIGRFMQAQAAGEGVTEAARLADKMIRTTQTTAMPEDLSQAERSPLLNAVGLNLFLGPMIIAGNRLQDAGIRGSIRGNVRSRSEAVGVWLALIFANGILFDLINGRGPDDDDEDDGRLDDWLAYIGKKAALFPVSTYPLVRDLAGIVEYGSARASPFAEAMGLLVKFGRDVGNHGEEALDGDEDAQARLARSGLKASGVLAPIPTGQLTVTGGEVYNLATGETEIETPADARYLLMRRDK